MIDLDVVEANLLRMQAYCDLHSLKLRPHIKTHKVPELALRQVQLGAVGITCQKLGEAEVMAEAGIEDIFMSYPQVGVGKAERLAALASRVKMSVAADSREAVEAAALAARISGVGIGVLIDFDSGAGRTGVVAVAQALGLAILIDDSPGLRLDGFMTYPLVLEKSPAFFAEVRSALSASGLEVKTFSTGATPLAWESHKAPGLTEVRHGTYIYNDRKTVADGVATLEDCALHVYATVISRPTPTRIILDSGSKTLSSDTIPKTYGEGYGLIREYPDAVIERLYEEHALVNFPAEGPAPKVGERVRVLPNHVCVVTNLHDEIPYTKGGEVAGVYRVAARGKSI